jgi:DNA mismatch repair protein MutS
MNFSVDQQTIKDLQIVADDTTKSIFSLFNQVKTSGGRTFLADRILHPTSDLAYLSSRKEEILFFQQHNIDLAIRQHDIDFIEHYLRQPTIPLRNTLIGLCCNE